MDAPTKREIASTRTGSNAPAAPDMAVNVVEVWQSGWNMLYSLATATAPVTGSGALGRRASLDGLVRRGMAQTVTGDDGREYELTAAGRALAEVLWPDDVKAAAKTRKPRTPRAANGRAKTPAAPRKAKADAAKAEVPAADTE